MVALVAVASMPMAARMVATARRATPLAARAKVLPPANLAKQTATCTLPVEAKT